MKHLKTYENNEDEHQKYYVYSVVRGSRTYRGSIWDSSQKLWIPDNAKLIGEFETDGRDYMIVSQEELDEINQIKAENKTREDSNKYNL